MNNYSDASRGTFQNEEYAKQLVSFEGMRFRGRDGKNNVTPTDIDGLVQLDNENCVIFFELKHKDGMPRGQLLALQDVCDAVEAGGRNSIVFLATHGTPAGQTIAAKDAETRTYYWRGEWRDIKPPKTLYEAINQFIGFVKAKGETT